MNERERERESEWKSERDTEKEKERERGNERERGGGERGIKKKDYKNESHSEQREKDRYKKIERQKEYKDGAPFYLDFMSVPWIEISMQDMSNKYFCIPITFHNPVVCIYLYTNNLS